jgi:hypothetical protein
MSMFQSSNIVATPSQALGELYPKEYYPIADAGCEVRVGSTNADDQETSRFITNFVLEALKTAVIQPFEQIPDLASRVKKGNLDPDTLRQISNVFANLPLFATTIAEGKVGQPLHGGRLEDAIHMRNLLVAKDTKGQSLLSFCGAPILGFLCGCVFRMKKMSVAEAANLVTDLREGSLVDVIGLRAKKLVDDSKKESQRREMVAQERLKSEEREIAKLDHRLESIRIFKQVAATYGFNFGK